MKKIKWKIDNDIFLEHSVPYLFIIEKFKKL
jgi:hypothetical protein